MSIVSKIAFGSEQLLDGYQSLAGGRGFTWKTRFSNPIVSHTHVCAVEPKASHDRLSTL